MKVVVQKGTNESLYIFPDHVPVDIRADMMRVGNPENPMFDGHDYYVCDCNTENVELHVNVPAPEEWKFGKYLFDGAAWTTNLNWVDPTPTPAPAPAQG
jgi:hypothetical protein